MTKAHAFKDRGQGQQDTARPCPTGWSSGRANAFDMPDVCFGGTGAATVYRRTALEEVAENGHFFDERMFMYKEDIDLAYRLLSAGHLCLFVPDAVAWHARTTSKSRRKCSKQERIWSAAHESLILRKHRHQWSRSTTIRTAVRQWCKWLYLLIFEPHVFLGARKLLRRLTP